MSVGGQETQLVEGQEILRTIDEDGVSVEVVSVVIKYMDTYMPHSVNDQVRSWVSSVSLLSKGRFGLEVYTFMQPLLTLIADEVERVLVLKSLLSSVPEMSFEHKTFFEGRPAGNETE